VEAGPELAGFVDVDELDGLEIVGYFGGDKEAVLKADLGWRDFKMGVGPSLFGEGAEVPEARIR
jgi:hypothetical protein